MAIRIDQGLPARPVFKSVPVSLEDQAGRGDVVVARRGFGMMRRGSVA